MKEQIKDDDIISKIKDFQNSDPKNYDLLTDDLLSKIEELIKIKDKNDKTIYQLYLISQNFTKILKEEKTQFDKEKNSDIKLKISEICSSIFKTKIDLYFKELNKSFDEQVKSKNPNIELKQDIVLKIFNIEEEIDINIPYFTQEMKNFSQGILSKAEKNKNIKNINIIHKIPEDLKGQKIVQIIQKNNKDQLVQLFGNVFQDEAGKEEYLTPLMMYGIGSDPKVCIHLYKIKVNVGSCCTTGTTFFSKKNRESYYQTLKELLSKHNIRINQFHASSYGAKKVMQFVQSLPEESKENLKIDIQNPYRLDEYLDTESLEDLNKNQCTLNININTSDHYPFLGMKSNLKCILDLLEKNPEDFPQCEICLFEGKGEWDINYKDIFLIIFTGFLYSIVLFVLYKCRNHTILEPQNDDVQLKITKDQYGYFKIDPDQSQNAAPKKASFGKEFKKIYDKFNVAVEKIQKKRNEEEKGKKIQIGDLTLNYCYSQHEGGITFSGLDQKSKLKLSSLLIDYCGIEESKISFLHNVNIIKIEIKIDEIQTLIEQMQKEAPNQKKDLEKAKEEANKFKNNQLQKEEEEEKKAPEVNTKIEQMQKEAPNQKKDLKEEKKVPQVDTKTFKVRQVKKDNNNLYNKKQNQTSLKKKNISSFEKFKKQNDNSKGQTKEVRSSQLDKQSQNNQIQEDRKQIQQ